MSAKIASLPPSERPRERLFRLGADHLATPELLSVILGSGVAGAPARAVAESLVSKAGGLQPLSRASAGELVGIVGVGHARATRVVAAFELGRRALAPPAQARITAAADVFARVRPRMANLVVEVGLVLGLSARNDVLFEVEIARGEATAIPVHPREVFRPLIRHGAVGGIFVHNHPSGDPTPSPDDVELTRRLIAVGDLVGIPLIDHVVVGGDQYTSLASLIGAELGPWIDR